MNVVDSLIVSIGLDATNFKKGQREVNDSWQKARGTALQHGRAIEDSNKKLVGSFNKLKVEALGFFAALLGAREIKEFVAQVTTANAAVGRLAANIGEQPQMLQAWGNAVERMGGNANDATQSLTNLSKSFFELKYNGKALPDSVYRVFAMARMPVPNREDSLDSALNKTAAALKEIAKQDRTAAFFFGEGMGLTDSTINLMLRYGAATAAHVKALSGLTATDKQIENSQKLIEKWKTLEQTANDIGRTIEGWFSGAFLETLDALQGVFTSIDEIVHGNFAGTKKRIDKNIHDPSSSGEFVPDVGGSSVSKTNPLPVQIVPNSTGSVGVGGGGGASAATPPTPIPSERGGAGPALRRRSSRTGARFDSSGHAVSPTPVDTGGSTIPGFTADETSDFLNRLGQYESGNRYIGNNAQGYGGRWQMGPNEVAGTGNKRDSDWYSNKGGVQDRSMMAYTLQHYNELVAKGIIKQGMSKEQIAGYLAAAHIGGVGGAQALATGQVRRDSNGTGTNTYFNMMKGLGSASAVGNGANEIGRWVPDPTGAGGRRWVRWAVDPGTAAERAGGGGGGHIVNDFGEVERDNAAGNRRHGWKARSMYHPLWHGSGGDVGIVPGTHPSLSMIHSVHPVTTSSTSNAMHIGAIHVNAPNATDAKGIAGDIYGALGRYQLSMSGQSGQV